MSEDFPLQNLPYGSVRRSRSASPRLCVALGEHAIELATIADRLPDVPRALVEAPNLDRLLCAEAPTWAALRGALASVLAEELPPAAYIPLDEASFEMPFTVSDYVDFYSSLAHATNVGRIFRPEGEPLMPNWRHLPVAYHGRASTVVVSGTPIRRPVVQLPAPGGPDWGPTRRLDIELELGFVTGAAPNPLGEPLGIERAAERIFGFMLVNDWSARDVQSWESRPLGPFLAKSFATSISPWVVPLAALEPYRGPGPRQEPEPLPYLRTGEPWGLDIALTATLQPADGEPERIITTNARELYWTPAQQLAHAASNGAVVSPGDLYASGTISGSEPGSQGCLLELTWNGERPLQLARGATRTFLEDGDTIAITGAAAEEGRPRIGFGELRGQVRPA